MTLPIEHRGRFAYHFTHLDNLEDILRYGLLAPNEQAQLGLRHRSIAIQSIQNRRSTMPVTCGPGGVVHDYVPFYCCKRSSMLLSVVNAKNVDQMFLIYFAVSLTVVERTDTVFTSASANTHEPPLFFDDPADLTELNWDAVDTLTWSMPSEEEKQARMAEVLIHKTVDLSLVDHIIIWNDLVRGHVQKAFSEASVKEPALRYDKYHYFTKWPKEPNRSLVTGPYWTKRKYEKCVKGVIDRGQNTDTARFKNIVALLQGLRADFSVLPETAEIVGLEPDNDVHTEDVGTHTQSVVRILLASEEYAALNSADQLLVELAAYLHDIGKGPKSRWADNNGKQKVDPDHPLRSADMLQRILTEEIGTIKQRSVRVLIKLVCYHDLVGDILGKGRKPEQLVEIAETERELDMLIAIGLADMRSVNPLWNIMCADKVPQLRDRVLEKLNADDDEEDR